MSITSQEAVTYSIQSTHVLNGQMYSTTLVLSVVGCDLLTRVYADFTKTNGALSSENFQVFNSNNEMILNGAGRNGTTGSTGTTIMLNTCLMVDTYTVKLLHSSGSTWFYSLFLTIKSIFNGVSFTISKSHLMINTGVPSLLLLTKSFLLLKPILESSISQIVQFLLTGIQPPFIPLPGPLFKTIIVL